MPPSCYNKKGRVLLASALFKGMNVSVLFVLIHTPGGVNVRKNKLSERSFFSHIMSHEASFFGEKNNFLIFFLALLLNEH